MNLHFDIPGHMGDATKTNHTMHGVEPGSKACKGKNGGVFNYGTAVHHCMLLHYSAPRNQRRCPDFGTSSDIGRRDNAGFPMDSCRRPQPDSWLYLLTSRKHSVPCQQPVDRQSPQIRRLLQSIDVTFHLKWRRLPSQVLQPVLKQLCRVHSGRSAQYKQFERRSVCVHGLSHTTAAIQMMLDHLFVVDLHVSAQAQDNNEFGAIFGAALELSLRSLPELFTLEVQPEGSRIQRTTTKERLSLRRRLSNEAANAYAEVPEPLHYSLFHRHSEYIEAGERDIAEALCRFSVFQADPANQHNGPYVHDCHLGAAARKIAEREGIQEGILRNRDMGSKARARCCKSNERKYCRII